MTPLQQAAKDIVERWGTSGWKDVMPTAGYIAELCKALDIELAQSVEPVAFMRQTVDGYDPVYRDAKYVVALEATTPTLLEGYALVPIEPTIGMMSQMPASSNSQEWKEYYSAMLEVAQGEIK